MATVENFVLRFKTEGAGGIKNLATDLQSLGDQMNPLANSTGALTGRLGLLGNAAFAGAAAFTALGLKAINLADQLGDLSDATGISASALLSLKESMISAGGDSDSYAKAVTKLSVAVGEAADGNEKYQKAFQKLGVYVTDASGKVRDGGDIMDDVIKQLAGIEDPAVRASRAVELLGKEASKIDWSKVSAGKDAITDEQVKQLAKYREEMDKVVAQFEKGLIKYFGDLAITINSGGIESGLAKITEQVGTLVGKLLNLPTDAIAAAWNALLPNWMRIDNAAGLGDPLIAAAKAAEKARQASTAGAGRGGRGGPTAEELAAYNASKNPAKKAAGGFGATPEATLKAIADSKTRIEQSQLEAKKLAELMNADDIGKIEIAAKYDIEKAKADIQNKERLNQSQKDAEFAAKRKEIEAKAALDIAKLQQDAAKQATDQTKAFQNQTAELQGRFDLQQSILGLSEVERDRQTKLFEALQDQKKAVEDIAKIKNLGTDERLKREQDINAEYEKRIGLINKEADIRAAREANFAQGAQEAVDQYLRSFTAFKQGEMMAQSVFSNMDSALNKFVETGKLNFGDLARSIIQDLLKIQLKAAVVGVFQAMGGGAGILGLFGLPTRAGGGPVTGTQPYMVGEKGPELFIPSTSGTIVPNGQGYGRSAGGTTIINNISAVDAKSVAQLFAENRMTLFGNVEQARRELPMRTR
jgi:hypothetical protein